MSEPRHRPDWGRGLRAMRALLEDPDSTRHALEVSYALDGDMTRRRFQRFLDHPHGRRMLAERPCLLTALSDREALASLPKGSFGRAYLEHMDRNGFDPHALVELRRRTDPVQDREEAEEWFAVRKDLMHDLWHVLSGYGADGAGEAALLPFSMAQYGGRSNLLLSLGATLRIWRGTRDARWFVYVWRSWRRGRRALRLDLLPYEELLALPLDEVRRQARIQPPEEAHPCGVIELPAAPQTA
ncbi:MAG: Coq4 family protein [Myxococcota bacterium]